MASPGASASRLASPVGADGMQVDGEPSVVTSVGPSSGPSSPSEQRQRKGTFFTNTHFYALFRLIEVQVQCRGVGCMFDAILRHCWQVLWSRLQLFKNLAVKLENKPALLLGMDTLRVFRRVSVDFAQRRVRFLLPNEAGG